MIQDCYNRLKTEESKIDNLIFIPVMQFANFLNFIQNKKLSLQQYIKLSDAAQKVYLPELSYTKKLHIVEKMRSRRDELIGRI